MKKKKKFDDNFILFLSGESINSKNWMFIAVPRIYRKVICSHLERIKETIIVQLSHIVWSFFDFEKVVPSFIVGNTVWYQTYHFLGIIWDDFLKS